MSSASSCAADSRSNASTSGPKMKRPDSRVRANASFSSGTRGAYCALTSTWGIRGTPRHGSGAAAAHDPHGDSDRDQDAHEDVEVAEVVVRLAPARAERPADAGEHEAPDRAADRGQDR